MVTNNVWQSPKSKQHTQHKHTQLQHTDPCHFFINTCNSRAPQAYRCNWWKNSSFDSNLINSGVKYGAAAAVRTNVSIMCQWHTWKHSNMSRTVHTIQDPKNKNMRRIKALFAHKHVTDSATNKFKNRFVCQI